jgi:predicted ferric reductase
VLLVARYKLLYQDWRGYLVAFFALVWVANQYMSIYNRLRLDIKHEQVEIKADEQKVDIHKVDDRKAA